jgi:hypothetical protein
MSGGTVIIEILVTLMGVSGVSCENQVEFWITLFRSIRKSEDKTAKL